MTADLLLNEEDYQKLIEQLRQFAKDNGVQMLNGSNGIIQVATTMLMVIEESPEAFMELTRLIYNVGYRDNKFTQLPIH
jgi:5-bromo-4-chloroindolyl phosphate hydrolysis protein